MVSNWAPSVSAEEIRSRAVEVGVIPTAVSSAHRGAAEVVMSVAHKLTGSTSPMTAAAYGEPHLTVATRAMARACGDIDETVLPRPEALDGIQPDPAVAAEASLVVGFLEQRLDTVGERTLALRAAATDFAEAWFDTAQGVATDAATDDGPVGTYAQWAAALWRAADEVAANAG